MVQIVSCDLFYAGLPCSFTFILIPKLMQFNESKITNWFLRIFFRNHLHKLLYGILLMINCLVEFFFLSLEALEMQEILLSLAGKTGIH